MKKAFCLLTMSVILVVAFFSCQKVGDDIYFPKMKLASVVENDEDGELSMDLNFIYDGKFLSSIVSGSSAAVVKYNDDNQISEIFSPENNDKIVMAYDKKKIKTVTYYNELGDVEYYSEFAHNIDGKISTVKTYSKDLYKSEWESLCNNMLFASVFNTMPIQQLLKQEFKVSLSLDGEEFWSYNGDNVETISTSYESTGFTINVLTTYQYDVNPNPYYGLPYALCQVNAYCKNNVVSSVTTTSVGSLNNTVTKKAEYTYGHKKYPTEVVYTQNGELEGKTFFTYIE